ncbi:MAG: hypothetical protein ACLP50_35160 [Solirubrobacteraceae bacterium]
MASAALHAWAAEHSARPSSRRMGNGHMINRLIGIDGGLHAS